MAELEIKPTPGARMAVLATLLLAAGISSLLVYLLTGGGRNLFDKKATIATFMPDVTGLSLKSDVRLSGIPIGTVSKIEISPGLDPETAVRVEMRVRSAFLKDIPKDSQTNIDADTLIGYNFVSIEEGKSPVALAAGGVLRRKQSADRTHLAQTLQDELRQVDDLLIQVSSSDTVIGRFVLGQAEYDNLLTRIGYFDKAIHSFVSAGSPVGQALFSDRLYKDQIQTPLLRVDAMLAAMQRGEGAAGKLFASDEQYNNLVRALRDLRAVVARAPLRDDAGYVAIQKMLAETDAMISSLSAGEGGMGRLLRNPELYESLNGSLRNMQELLKDFREHPQKYLRYKVF